MRSLPLPTFTARTIPGAARGRKLGYPTINVDLRDVPETFAEGIYACRVTVDGRSLEGALHYGPRPAFDDGVSCEVHVLDVVLERLPDSVTIEPVERLRDVRDFPDGRSLAAQIADDIRQTRTILAKK